jgi:hypothetical protein
MLPTFLYWHKRNGGGGWNVAVFLFGVKGWLSSLLLNCTSKKIMLYQLKAMC